jgi:hypothetical protein
MNTPSQSTLFIGEVMNVPVIGKIYHVVDTETGRVIKVGSTIREVAQRFAQSDYKNRYTSHSVVEVKRFESSEQDRYDSRDAYCPFLWHLVAAEHIEIARQGTFGVGLSNRISPLVQKFHSKLGLSDLSSEGGKLGGREHVRSGHLWAISSKGGKSRTLESKRRNGLQLLLSKKGVFAPGIAAQGGRAGGPKAGRLAVESGQLASLRTFEHQSKASKSANHNRWHINRNITNPKCLLCREGSNSNVIPS